MQHRLKWLVYIMVASFVWFGFSACRGIDGGETSTLTPGKALLTRWLNAEPCSSPCWEGIMPGETSASEAMELLEANSLVTNVQLHESGHWSAVEWDMMWSTSDNQPSSSGGIAVFDSSASDQIIRFISLYFRGLCLGDIVHSYGDPSHILIYPDRTSLNHGVFGAMVEVFWLPLDLRLIVNGTSKPRIDEHLCDGAITFHAPGTTLDDPSISVDYLLPWDGYADFDKYFLASTGHSQVDPNDVIINTNQSDHIQEAGYVVAHNAGDIDGIPFWSQDATSGSWSYSGDPVGPGGAPSLYALTNPSEYFAESWVVYICQNASLPGCAGYYLPLNSETKQYIETVIEAAAANWQP